MAGYIIDLQKSVVFPCTASNVLSERETEKTIPLTIASERIKYLRIHLIEEVKDLYTENYKPLMKENLKTQIHGKTSQVNSHTEPQKSQNNQSNLEK